MPTFYDSGNTKVTDEKLISGDKVIPISMIESCVTFHRSLMLGTVLINAAGVVLAIYLLSFFSLGFVIASLLIGALCGFVLKSEILDRPYLIMMDLHNRSKFEISLKDPKQAEKIFLAIQTARRS